MSKAALLAAAIALALGAAAAVQVPAAETELAQLVADCNVMAGSRSAKRRSIQACETLANENHMTLVEPAAAGGVSAVSRRAFPGVSAPADFAPRWGARTGGLRAVAG